MKVQQEHNFFTLTCEEIGERRKDGSIMPVRCYYRACQARVKAIRDEVDDNRWPECRHAVERKRCPAQQMLGQEIIEGPIFYRDRDDCPPGIASRADLGLPERTSDEIAHHRYLLRKHGLEPFDRSQVAAPVMTHKPLFGTVSKTEDKPGGIYPPPAPQTFDLGRMISEEAEKYLEGQK